MAELAKEAGVGSATWYRWRAGTQWPQRKTWPAIARVGGYSLAELGLEMARALLEHYGDAAEVELPRASDERTPLPPWTPGDSALTEAPSLPYDSAQLLDKALRVVRADLETAPPTARDSLRRLAVQLSTLVDLADSMIDTHATLIRDLSPPSDAS